MRILPIVLSLLAPVVVVAQDVVRLDDIGIRLQFAFYTGDVNALERDLASVRALDVPVTLRALQATYAGFGAWKSAELLRGKQSGQAGEAARRCAMDLETAVALEPRRPGLLAMLADCQRLIAELEGRVKAPLAAGRARQSLERAIALGPKNPHVLLIEGAQEFERVRASASDVAGARTKLNAAATAFEAQASASDVFTTAMSWGHAETWNLLGQLALVQGDRAAARDAFERALVLAGDYAEARQRLNELTTAPR